MKSPFRSTLKLYVLSELCQLKDDKADSGVIQHSHKWQQIRHDDTQTFFSVWITQALGDKDLQHKSFFGKNRQFLSGYISHRCVSRSMPQRPSEPESDQILNKTEVGLGGPNAPLGALVTCIYC